MTTSSKTNMNEDLKKEFYDNVNYDEAELGCNWSMDDLWDWIQTAISKAREESKREFEHNLKVAKKTYKTLLSKSRESGFEEGLEAGMKIDREQFKANFLTQKK